ncbi:dicarboxylate/amino acid:cation symporter [Bacterioplanes sanyensis]|uniref:Dicarboxylate/amino acid:cation symporter n=1 Tax=Bacterioplanes sanyensis TaxID=1249553 RepID=A0A222FJ27_9GAMM|nr:dicarboxylate/amino acid:cation symporter [Bacterioplanes sanyensis]ASP39045.1 dicarboxylate/amino acid:cation symporter [Bacterioplanes sanyensis]
MPLTHRIVIAMVLAIVLGSLAQWMNTTTLPESIDWFLNTLLVGGVFAWMGKVFVAGLKLLVVPLVFVSLVCGVGALRDQSSLGRLSLKTIVLYLVTTGIAISIALTMATIIAPGEGIDLPTDTNFTPPPASSLLDVFVALVPTNGIAAMANASMLQVIVFAILVGTAIGRAGEPGKRLAAHFEDWNEAMMKLVEIIMHFAPYGVFALLFNLFASEGLGTVGQLVLYMFTVILVLAMHMTIVYPLMLRGLTGLSPLRFLSKMRGVQMFAFSTASSGATIPVTLRTVEERLGVDNRVASFAVPMGATINMDGTAIMQGVATVFIAQAFAQDLSMVDYLLVVLTAMLASIGTAGVPGVGLVTLAMVLNQVGLPAEGIALIIGVDRLLDMLRTAVNVTGDAAVSTIVAHSEGALDEGIFNDPKAGEVRD